jgi:hypothetical protein
MREQLWGELALLSIAVALLAAPALIHAQTRDSTPPRFEDYPAKETYSRIPAPPKIVTPAQRRFRTRIREGVEKGWGVFQNGLGNGKEQNRPGPNFAGNMIVIEWGCGAPCQMIAVVDAETGDPGQPVDGHQGDTGLL